MEVEKYIYNAFKETTPLGVDELKSLKMTHPAKRDAFQRTTALAVGIYQTNILFEGSNYFDNQVQIKLSPVLSDLYLDLVKPLREPNKINLSGANINIKIANPDSKYWKQASDIVNYSYNSMYLADTESIIDIAKEDPNITNITLPIVVLDRLNGEEIVVGTHRLVLGDQLEVFRLFEIIEGKKWPHNLNGDTKKTGEFIRLSFHPLIDALVKSLPDDQAQEVKVYRKKILQKLWVFSLGAMKGLGVETSYLVLAPHVHRFLVRNGLNPIDVPDIYPSPTPFSKEIRKRFKEYWKPDADFLEQPKVYIAPCDFK